MDGGGAAGAADLEFRGAGAGGVVDGHPKGGAADLAVEIEGAVAAGVVDLFGAGQGQFGELGGGGLEDGHVGFVEAAPVGADDEVLRGGLDDDIVDGDAGQAVVEGKPAAAGVGAVVKAVVGTDEEQVGGGGVLVDNVDGLGGQVGVEGRPAVAAVAGDVEVGLEIVVAVAVQRGVNDVGVVLAGRYAGDPEVLGKGLVQAGPGLTPVGATVDHAVVATDVDQVTLQGAFADGGQGAVADVSGAAAVGEVLAGKLEVVAPVGGLVELVGAEVEHVGVVGADQDGALPVPAQGALAELVLGREVGGGVRFGIDPVVVAVLKADVGRGVVPRVDLHLHAVAAEEHLVGVLAALAPAGARLVVRRPAPGAVVLQAAVDAVAVRVIVDRYGVELAQGGGVGLLPVLPSVVADVDAAVVAVDEVIRAVGVDPQGVVIGVHVVAVDARPGRSAVGGFDDRDAQAVERGGVVGQAADLAEVIAVGVVNAVEVTLVGLRPGLPVGLGAVDFEALDGGIEEEGISVFEVLDELEGRQFVAFDAGTDAVGRHVFGEAVAAQKVVEEVGLQAEEIGLGHATEGLLLERFIVAVAGFGRAAEVVVDTGVEDGVPAVFVAHRQADAAGAFPYRKAAFWARDPGPVRPAVGALPDAAATAGFLEVPGFPLPFPAGGVEVLGVARVLNEVDHAGGIVHVKRLRPRPSTVAGFKNAALFVRPVEVAQGGDPDGAGVLLVHDQAADVVGVFQAHVRPALPAVGAAVHAIAGVGGAAGIYLARPYVDRFRVPVHGDRADRHHRQIVEKGRESDAVVPRLPESAAGVGHVKMGRIAGVHGQVRHPPAHDAGPDIFEGQAGRRALLPQQQPLLVGLFPHVTRRGVLGAGAGAKAAAEEEQGEEEAHSV